MYRTLSGSYFLTGTLLNPMLNKRKWCTSPNVIRDLNVLSVCVCLTIPDVVKETREQIDQRNNDDKIDNVDG